MATKKPEAQDAAPAEEKKEETGYDPYERVEVFIPRGEKNGDPNLYVSVNNYSALLPRGQKSMVPRYIAEEIERAREAENAFWEYAASREIKE